jgi:hypothetical protein
VIGGGEEVDREGGKEGVILFPVREERKGEEKLKGGGEKGRSR